MAVNNKALSEARRNKKDEFYTQLEDIENEVRHYTEHFRGKTVFCNCDDPFESNFFKYFALNFNRLGLKKLICTCYAGSPIVGKQLSLFDDQVIYAPSGDEPASKTPYKAIVTSVFDTTGDGGVDMFDVAELFKNGENKLEKLTGNGDFRSDECLELLKESDIVVTNPPFSLFREYLAQLIEHNKKFLIIGNQNAITYKEVFPLIKDNKMWLGPSVHSGDRKFHVPNDYPLEAAGCGTDPDGRKWVRVKGIRWYTNLEHKKRHEELPLYKRYTPSEYPTYDNYDAIDVSKTDEIPTDFSGVMGVPITFFDKYCPDQFEVLGITDRNNQYGLTTKVYTKNDSPNYGDLNRRAAIRLPDGTLKSTFAKVLIRNKHPEATK